MSELIVLAFKDEATALEARRELINLQKQHLIALADAAMVTRREDGKVKIKQAYDLVGVGALGGAFWGMLIGLFFFMPWLGMAIGAITGAIAGKLSDFGISDDFIKEVGESVQPGQAALFLMVHEMTEDRVLPELAKFQPTILRTNLSQENEAKLKQALGVFDDEEEPTAAAL
ncbi:MAG: DUF1269 domain-containing protein [Caldilineales bacterium]|nr:DUF1269 domain-containing protein [Caldilineales bacterium]MDW8317930.1 DUF1269 domain-containing protein [Anaerolineae bacterium]